MEQDQGMIIHNDFYVRIVIVFFKSVIYQQ